MPMTVEQALSAFSVRMGEAKAKHPDYDGAVCFGWEEARDVIMDYLGQ